MFCRSLQEKRGRSPTYSDDRQTGKGFAKEGEDGRSRDGVKPFQFSRSSEIESVGIMRQLSSYLNCKKGKGKKGKKKNQPHDKPVEVTKRDEHKQNQRCTHSNDYHSTED